MRVAKKHILDHRSLSKLQFLRACTLLIPFLLAGFVSFSQTTTVHVPDANFRAKLTALSGINDGSGASVIVDDISTITVLEVQGDENTADSDKISDLAGIEAFTALTELRCHRNKLTSLDVSANTALTKLWCSGNQLTSLDVSANTALTKLFCANNQLTSLDVSANTALTVLYCGNNQLTSLDVSANTALTALSCNVNLLTSLDVSANTALTQLLCFGNQLTSLDVSANTALGQLWCPYNQLTSLDVSANTALVWLWCSSNHLTSLDVANGNNNNFFTFSAIENSGLSCIQVDDVDYSTANWLDGKDATAIYSTDCSNFSTVPTVYVPDANFRAKLISQSGINEGSGDSVIVVVGISTITVLDVSGAFSAPDSEKISDLTGIEAFTALTG